MSKFYEIKGSTLTSIANAVREKRMEDKNYTPEEMVSELSKPSYIHYENHRINSIPYCAFYHIKDLKTIYCDTALGANSADNQLREIGSHAFNNTGLISAKFPSVYSIGDCAFYECYELQELDLKNTQTLNNMVFYCCDSLKEIILPSITLIRQKVFHRCFNLEKIVLPKSGTCQLESVGSFDGTPFYPHEQFKINNVEYTFDLKFDKDGYIYVDNSSNPNLLQLYRDNASTQPGFAERVRPISEFNPANEKVVYIYAPSSYKTATNWKELNATFVEGGI